MRTFKVVSLKVQNLIASQNTPAILIEQTFLTENEVLNIKAPIGYSIISITEILPQLIIKKNEEVTN